MVMENILAMKELERGHEYANQLQRLILNKSYNNIGEDDDGVLTTSYAPDLAAKVEDSLRNAIFLLNSPPLSSVSADLPPNFDDSHETAIKNRRRFSPQKRKSIETWEEYSKIGPKEDGYAWRKYGEKIILNSKYPRCYLRCSNKYDQGCEATKQVQIIQDDPLLYKTTYFGHHTCTQPQMFLHSHNDLSSSTCFISFDNNHNHNSTTSLTQPNHPNSMSSPFPRPVRNMEEYYYCKNIKQDNITVNDYVPSSSSSNDCLLSFPGEVLPFESDDDILCM